MSRASCKSSFAAFAAILLLGPVSAIAAVSDRTEREPLVITSSSMEAERLGDRVTFTGNVTLKKEIIDLEAKIQGIADKYNMPSGGHMGGMMIGRHMMDQGMMGRGMAGCGCGMCGW